MFRHQPSVKERLESDPARTHAATPHHRSTAPQHSLQQTRTSSSSLSSTTSAMRKAGELLEDALGLGGPGSPRRSAQAAQAAGTTAAGPPEWASSEHYPGQPSSAPRVYPDDSKQVAAADAYGFGVRGSR